jgi:hypothetical protein
MGVRGVLDLIEKGLCEERARKPRTLMVGSRFEPYSLGVRH